MNRESKKIILICDEINKIIELSFTHINFFSNLLQDHEEVLEKAFLAAAISNGLIDCDYRLSDELEGVLDFLKKHLKENSYTVIEDHHE